MRVHGRQLQCEGCSIHPVSVHHPWKCTAAIHKIAGHRSDLSPSLCLSLSLMCVPCTIALYTHPSIHPYPHPSTHRHCPQQIDLRMPLCLLVCVPLSLSLSVRFFLSYSLADLFCSLPGQKLREITCVAGWGGWTHTHRRTRTHTHTCAHTLPSLMDGTKRSMQCHTSQAGSQCTIAERERG